MKLHRCLWTLPVLAALLLLGGLRPARADIAPPPPPSSASILSGSETTQVRMVAETVIIEVANNAIDQPARARVHATFQMRNLGTQEERMQVRFPLNLLYPMYQNDIDTCVYPLAAPEINDFTAKVDGRAVAVQNSMETLKDDWRNLPPKSVHCWANFAVTFPVEQDVLIEVGYSVEGYHSQIVNGQVSFPYVLLTGAGWKGTIGRAEIILRAPFALDEVTLVYAYPEGAAVQGSELRWVFEDFEPQENVEAALLNPGLWQRILREQNTLAKNPNDGEAWGRLGRWYKEANLLRRGFRDGPGAEKLYSQSKEAYGKAVSLLPKDADWHAGYAELLCWNAWYPTFGSHSQVRDDLVQCLNELRLSLALNPRQAKALELLEVFSWNPSEKLVQIDGAQVTYLALTATPTARPEETRIVPPSSTPIEAPEPTRTAPPAATATARPSATPAAAATQPATATQLAAATEAGATQAQEAPTSVAAQPTPAPRGRGGLCSAALIPLAGVGTFRLLRLRKKAR